MIPFKEETKDSSPNKYDSGTTLKELAGWEKPKNTNTKKKKKKGLAFLKPQVRARKQLAFAPDSSVNVTSLRYFQHNKLLPNGKLKE